MDHVPLGVREQLHLDVARRRQVALEVDRVAAERGAGTIGRGPEGLTSSSSVPAAAIPIPPPPPAALTSTGYPIRPAASRASSTVPTVPAVPGTVCTPASATSARATALSFIRSMVAGGGPMKVNPASWTARANAACSDRNP
jgi:hypothetical protein